MEVRLVWPGVILLFYSTICLWLMSHSAIADILYSIQPNTELHKTLPYLCLELICIL